MIDEKKYYEIDFESGELNLYPRSKHIRIDYFHDDKTPIYEANSERRIIVEKSTNTEIDAFNGKYLRSTNTGKILKYDGKKIELHNDTERLKAYDKVQKDPLELTHDKEDLIIREFLINSSIKNTVYWDWLLPLDYKRITEFMNQDGFEHYYKIFIIKDNMENFLEYSDNKFIRKIYFACVFAYHHMMNNREQQLWLNLLKTKEILKKLCLKGNLDFYESKYLDYINTNKEKEEKIEENVLGNYYVRTKK